MITETKIPERRCPFCDYKLDVAASVYNKKNTPKPGDISICLSCASILIFNDDLTIRKPEPGEIEITPEIHKIQQAIRSVDRRDLKG